VAANEAAATAAAATAAAAQPPEPVAATDRAAQEADRRARFAAAIARAEFGRFYRRDDDGRAGPPKRRGPAGHGGKTPS
jgi:hypothetical protein